MDAVKGAKAIAVLEKDISFGSKGTVCVNVESAIAGLGVATLNAIGGLGGADIGLERIREVFLCLRGGKRGIVWL
jgi:pyruvate ferredoxin oxidoreductase alpha subunit